MNSILVPVDFSATNGKVVETAASLGRELHARVILAHICEPQPQFTGYDPGPLTIGNAVGVAVPADPIADRKRLQIYDPVFEGLDVLRVCNEGSISEEILSLARDHNVDWIVMGSHGHGALYHLVAGSVTNAVLKGSPCPVVIVPCARH